MQAKAETRSVLRRAVSSARSWMVSSVWCVPGDQQEGPKAKTRSVPRRAVSSARSWKLSSVWYVPGDRREGPKADTRSVLRRAISSARSWKVSSVWHVPGDQQEGPLPSHCCCACRCRRKGAPFIEKPPVKEQGLWARWKAKAKSLRKKSIGDIGETLP